MIKAKDAIATARGLIGTPYKELDCINLIKKVIRTAPGGVSSYTTAGTNTLWKSYNSSTKYRDLTWRQESIAGARSGMLAFKRDGEDVHHVGLVTGEGTVIHSSSVKERVVETPLSAAEGWNLLAVHRYIETAAEAAESEGNGMTLYRAEVVLHDEDSVLYVRNKPGTDGDVIGRLHHGAQVSVQAESDSGWMDVTYGDGGSGYVSGEYLERVEEDEKKEWIGIETFTTLVSADSGARIVLGGKWAVESID